MLSEKYLNSYIEDLSEDPENANNLVKVRSCVEDSVVTRRKKRSRGPRKGWVSVASTEKKISQDTKRPS